MTTRPEQATSVDDFVSVEHDDVPNLAHVLVWTQDGESQQIMRETCTTCLAVAATIRDALRTWDGWK